MIHAYLFLTKDIRDREIHNSSFIEWMNYINTEAATHITTSHYFYQNVSETTFRKYWWQCQGRCKKVVRRDVNRPPSAVDWFWAKHEKLCGGTFIKIKEPEPESRKRSSSENFGSESPQKRSKTMDRNSILSTSKNLQSPLLSLTPKVLEGFHFQSSLPQTNSNQTLYANNNNNITLTNNSSLNSPLASPSKKKTSSPPDSNTGVTSNITPLQVPIYNGVQGAPILVPIQYLPPNCASVFLCPVPNLPGTPLYLCSYSSTASPGPMSVTFNNPAIQPMYDLSPPIIPVSNQPQNSPKSTTSVADNANSKKGNYVDLTE